MTTLHNFWRWLSDAASFTFTGVMLLAVAGLLEGGVAGMVLGLELWAEGKHFGFNAPVASAIRGLLGGAMYGAVGGMTAGCFVFSAAACYATPHTGDNAVLGHAIKLAVRGTALGVALGATAGTVNGLALRYIVPQGFWLHHFKLGIGEHYLMSVVVGFVLGGLWGVLAGVRREVSKIKAAREM